jgi:hypothetical protein
LLIEHYIYEEQFHYNLLYNQYIQEIEGFKARGEVHTLKDSRYRGAIIKNI